MKEILDDLDHWHAQGKRGRSATGTEPIRA